MIELPKKNDVLLVKYGFDAQVWYVHEAAADVVLVGPRSWLVRDFLWWGRDELEAHKAKKIGRCVRFWIFNFFRFGKQTTEQ